MLAAYRVADKAARERRTERWRVWDSALESVGLSVGERRT